jgi:hypothetical protein
MHDKSSTDVDVSAICTLLESWASATREGRQDDVRDDEERRPALAMEAAHQLEPEAAERVLA